MAQLTVCDLKSYLRIQHDAEDSLLAGLLARASAMVEAFLGKPIYLRQETRLVRVGGDAFRGGATALFLPIYPITQLISLTSADGSAITLSDLVIDKRQGVVEYRNGTRFAFGAYTAVVNAGLESLPEFDGMIEPAINSALCDVVADLYQRRNPVASAEREGGGVGVEYGSNQRSGVADNYREDQIPNRIASSISHWRMLGAIA
jgi:uncharacterized phiE125 gp8 family phage protein